MTLHLHGVGHFHPEVEITNRFLEELDIGTSEGWIVERVGILSRRTTLPLDYIRTTRNRDPRAAAQAWEKFGPDDDVALVGVGAGLSRGGARLRFEAAA